MKKNVIKILILIIIVIFLVKIPCFTFATASIPSILNNDITDDVNPENVNETKLAEPFTELILEVVKNVLGAIQIIGGLLTIISVAVYGLIMLLSSQPGLMEDIGIDVGPRGDPNVRMKLMNYLRILIIGAALLFSSSSIVVFVMGILLS